MSPEGSSIIRLAGIGLAILALVLGGIVIGVNLGPRAARVEEKVIAPVRQATSGRDRGDAMPDMIEAACPAVVSIGQERAGPEPARRRRSGKAAGAPPLPRVAAGFLVSSDGFVLTASAALADDGPIEIRLNDGRVFPATRAGRDPLSGLAMLRIEGRGFPFLAFAEAGFPRVGETGIALASPAARGCTAEAAMVSGDFIAGSPGLRAFFRVEPALNPRLAGLPLLDRSGAVIGIAGLVSPAAADEADSTSLLPAATAARIVSELMRGGSAIDNDFGLDAEDLVPVLAARIGADRQRGAMVSLVAPGSQAEAAGLKAGDVVFAAAGEPISGASELARALDEDAAAIPLEVMRDRKRLKLVLERKAVRS